MARSSLTRRGTLLSGVAALAAAVAGCSSGSERDALDWGGPPDVTRPYGARPYMTRPSVAQAGVAQAGVAPVDTAQAGGTRLGELINAGPELSVGGERLDAGQLRTFYARHGFEPVWASRPAQEKALTEMVMRSGEHGLNPDLFHAAALRQAEGLPAAERELLLTDAVLLYGSALAQGAVPVDRRSGDQTLTPEPVDVAAVLDEAADSYEPAARIEALAPSTPGYEALRRALAAARVGASMGISPGATGRVRALEVNLERQRWLPRTMPGERVFVNVADQRLVMYRADQPVFATRVVVGEDVKKNQSPEFKATIDASFLNPPWVVPSDIASAEILPLVKRDPGYLARNKMVVLANGDVEQLPGPEAGLGLIMFDMPNRFDVYLHDTPERYVFSKENRRMSHGCIRVENPRQLAALLLEEPVGDVNQGIEAGNTTRVNLPVPVPVFVAYQTAFADDAGTVQFRPDFYGRDPGVWRALQERKTGKVVQAQL